MKQQNKDGIYTGGVAMLACAAIGGGAGFITLLGMMNVRYYEPSWLIERVLGAIGYTVGITCLAISMAAVYAVALVGQTLARSFATVFGMSLGWSLGLLILIIADLRGYKPQGQWWEIFPAHLPLAIGIVGAAFGYRFQRRILGFSRATRRKTLAGWAVGLLAGAIGVWLFYRRLRLNNDMDLLGALGIACGLGAGMGGIVGAIWGADRVLKNDGFALDQPVAVLPLTEETPA
jgi:hypothetical protein